MDFITENGVDRISGLPDHVLCHILSFLPTKYAVGTCILSTRWKYLWTSVPVLDFDARLRGKFCHAINMNACPGSETTFKNFVNRVMLLNDIPLVKKFRLIYECQNNPASIRTWLHVAISRGIQELELDFFMSVGEQFVKLPRNFFMSDTLVILKLSRLPLSIPHFVCFPILKILELKSVTGPDDKCIQNLLSGCQVLEYLVVEETIRERPRVINVSIDTLRSFSFSYRFSFVISVDRPYRFIINAPNLKTMHVKGCISDDFVIENLASLVTARLDLRQTGVGPETYSLCYQHVYDLFQGITNAKFVSLSHDVVQLLCAASILNLPRFPNLTKLAFGIGFDIRWIRVMTKFVQCSPNFTVVTLNNKQVIIRDMEEVQQSPLHLPDGLLSCLKHMLVEEVYSHFRAEAVENLVQDVNNIKRLEINCQCPFLLKSQIGF